MHTKAQRSSDLRRLGVEPGGTLMVHASVRAVGEIAGGPDEIHLGSKDVVTPAGTFLMCAGSPRYYDKLRRGNLTPEQRAELLEKLPAFDPLTARSDQDDGALVTPTHSSASTSPALLPGANMRNTSWPASLKFPLRL